MDETDTYIKELIYKVVSTGNIGGKERSVTQNIKLSLGSSITTETEKIVVGKENVIVGTEDVIVGYEDVVVGTEEISVSTVQKVSTTPQFAIQALETFTVGNGNSSSVVGCVSSPDIADKKNKVDVCGSSVNLIDISTIQYKLPDTKGWDTTYLPGNPLKNNTVLTTLAPTSTDFVIDVGDKDLAIVVDYLDFSKVSSFKIKGTGKLSIYVKENIKFGQHSSFGDIDQFNLLYFGNTITFPNHVAFSGSLFVNSANISVNAGTNFKGNILAPNSKVYLNLGNMEVLEGTIIGKDVEVNGGHVTYRTNTISTFETVVTKEIKEIIEKRPIIEKREIIETRDIVEERVKLPDEISIININSIIVEQ